MKICYLNNHLYLRGGAERVMFDEAALMRSAGHDIEFFGCRGPDDIEHKHADLYPPSVPIDQLKGIDKWKHAYRVVYNPAMGRAFKCFLDVYQPQLLHAHNIYGALTTAVLDIARAAKIPVVLTAHDYKLVCPSYLGLDHGRICMACTGGRFYNCLLKRCHKSSLAASTLYTTEAYLAAWGRKYDVARRIICPSRFMLQTFLNNGYKPERLIYLPNFVPCDSIVPTCGEGSYVLYTGRLSEEKGLTTLLGAMEGLDLPLRIVGDGPLRGSLQKKIEQAQLGKRVVFVGYQSGQALANEYRNAACLVLPSEWYENAPMSILEAFAHGKPVIGANIGGIPELIEEGVNGMLFPSGDVAALHRVLADFWQHRSAWRDYGAAARKRVERDFSPSIHMNNLRNIYEDCLRRG